MTRFKLTIPKPVIIGLGIGLLLCVGSFAGWLITTKVESPGGDKQQLQAVLKKLERHIILPAGDDNPTLATVSDQTKLKDPFLAQAKNGDKLIIFYKAQKAILYRPSLDRIVDIGPLFVDAAVSEVNGTKIAIRNGSRNESLTRVVEGQVGQTYPEANIVDTGSASRLDFPTTIIVDLSPGQTKSNFAAALAQVVGGQVGIMPVGEPKPTDADILIIIGADLK
ncbi:LytR C-terminal domain-containing protein [Candidatus Saccharibacteria bacterium]|nr:LytR C-terminal domain-containing protein [Candidatus Saccharibacteria bacterium]